MSDVAIARGGDGDGAFRARTVALLLIVGIVGFIGTLVLGAYAPDFRRGHDGGNHALSNAATGLSGIVQLAEATGRHPRIIRNEHDFATEDLVVLTPPDGGIDLSKALAARPATPVLVVLPKWETTADPKVSGWVRYGGVYPSFVPEGVLSPQYKFRVVRYRSGGRPLVIARDNPAGLRFVAPRPVQTIAGAGVQPVVSDAQGHVVIGKVPDRPLWVLADPDLIDNAGMRDARQAAAALALLDWLNSNQARGIAFDVTLNGLGHARSPLKLLFEPPFLAMTLTIAAAVLLAALHALASFGGTRPRERAIAFGKAALVDNTAALVRKAGREARLGSRYGDVMRERARVLLRAPRRLGGTALDAWLDRRAGRPAFTPLAQQVAQADTPATLLTAARALHHWQEIPE